jgi:hypothetical protein
VILVNGQWREGWLLRAVDRRLREELAKLDLRLNEAKSRVVDLTQGEAFGFLGFTLTAPLEAGTVVGADGAGPEEADGVAAEAPGGVPALARSACEAGDRGDQPDLAGLGELFPGRQRGAVLQHREELGREEGAASFDAAEGPPGLRLEAVE